jgi:hypothetical protein
MPSAARVRVKYSAQVLFIMQYWQHVPWNFETGVPQIWTRLLNNVYAFKGLSMLFFTEIFFITFFYFSPDYGILPISNYFEYLLSIGEFL